MVNGESPFDILAGFKIVPEGYNKKVFEGLEKILGPLSSEDSEFLESISEYRFVTDYIRRVIIRIINKSTGLSKVFRISKSTPYELIIIDKPWKLGLYGFLFDREEWKSEYDKACKNGNLDKLKRLKDFLKDVKKD